MKLVMYALWAIWFAGAIGWNAAGFDHGDRFTPKGIIWPLVAAYHFSDSLYDKTQTAQPNPVPEDQ